MDDGGGKVETAGVAWPDEEFDLGAAVDDTFGSGLDEVVDDAPVGRAEFVADLAENQFVIDDLVAGVAFVSVGGQYLQAVVAHPVGVDRFFHGEARAEQGDPAQVVCAVAAAVASTRMEQRYGDRCADVVSDLVHRVGAPHDALSAGSLERRGFGGEQFPDAVPAPLPGSVR